MIKLRGIFDKEGRPIKMGNIVKAEVERIILQQKDGELKKVKITEIVFGKVLMLGPEKCLIENYGEVKNEKLVVVA